MTGDPPSIVSEPAPPVPPTVPPRPARRLTWIVAILAFAIGVATVIALLPLVQRWQRPAQTAQTTSAAPATAQQTVTPTITAAVPLTLDGLAARQAMLDAQLRDIESRVAATDTATRTASGYATRAEGMMIAFAARRALDRGLQLGYVEGQLRNRFGTDEPQAVTIVVAAAKAPVTREDLRQALDTIAPGLTSGSTRTGFWRAVGRELSELIVLRRDSTPSPRAADRLERARRLIDAGNIEAALAEVARMPGAGNATSWIDAAKRYIEARRALNRIEVAAINGQATQPAVPAPNPVGNLPGA